jgi:hypothetical protein
MQIKISFCREMHQMVEINTPDKFPIFKVPSAKVHRKYFAEKKTESATFVSNDSGDISPLFHNISPTWGVNVMITILSVFLQFSANKMPRS